MLARNAIVVVALVLAAVAAAPPSCPAANGRVSAACAGRTLSVARCVADAAAIERCADRASGLVHAIYLARAAVEWAAAGLADGRTSARGRRRLAHAALLDERVQDDPNAPAALRASAQRDEKRVNDALFRR